MKRTYTGGCHCGAVAYAADIDLTQGTIRCNCSICSKSRAWLIAVPVADFRLSSGAEALTEYRFGANRVVHPFCKHCGVKSFARVNLPDGGGFVAVAVNCLNDVPDADLAALPVMYIDGRHDDFQTAPEYTRHL